MEEKKYENKYDEYEEDKENEDDIYAYNEDELDEDYDYEEDWEERHAEEVLQDHLDTIESVTSCGIEEELRALINGCKFINIPKEMQMKFAKDEDESVRLFIARCEYVYPEALDELALDDSYRVRMAVILNASTSIETREKIDKNESEEHFKNLNKDILEALRNVEKEKNTDTKDLGESI